MSHTIFGRIRVLIPIMALMVMLAACSGDKTDPVHTLEPVTDQVVTYETHIAPIMETRCLGCHSITRQGADRNGAPVGVNFDTYADMVQWSDRALARILAGTMPPGGGVTEEEQSSFQTWVDNGRPEREAVLLVTAAVALIQ